MMSIKKMAMLVILATVISFFIIGCNNEMVEPEDIFIEEEVLDEVVNDIEAEIMEEVITRKGKADRLPGSLKIGSIVIYKSGEDFLVDNPEGLKAVTTYTVETTQSSSGSTSGSSSSVSSSVQVDSSSASESGTSGGGSTIVINQSGGGETMKGTVTGQGSITTTTTITFD